MKIQNTDEKNIYKNTCMKNNILYFLKGTELCMA